LIIAVDKKPVVTIGPQRNAALGVSLWRERNDPDPEQRNQKKSLHGVES
jgi:hypothetical protein